MSVTINQLQRRRPDPIPPLRPVPEYLAGPELAACYADVRETLQVPWMGVVTMAYARYHDFFDALWQGLRPLVLSRPFVEESRRLRAFIEAGVDDLSPPPLIGRLETLGYAEREIDEIRNIIEVLSHGNHLYVIVATIARLMLEGGEMAGRGDAPRFEGRHAPEAATPFILLEPHHADGPTSAVYDDVKASLRLPFVNTDYRALARWPSYFALAWGDLKPLVGGNVHEGLCLEFHRRVVDAVVGGLPNPGGLTSKAVREAAQRDAPEGEVLHVARLFQWLLPGLMTNVAFFRRQLAAD